MIAKTELLQALQKIAALQQDLATVHERLAVEHAAAPPDEPAQGYVKTCRDLARDTRLQAECVGQLCTSIQEADRHEF